MTVINVIQSPVQYKALKFDGSLEAAKQMIANHANKVFIKDIAGDVVELVVLTQSLVYPSRPIKKDDYVVFDSVGTILDILPEPEYILKYTEAG